MQKDNNIKCILANASPPDNIVDLDIGKSWRLTGKRCLQALFCLQGCVWVTQERGIHDYVLNTGEAFIVSHPGLVMVKALSTSRIGYTKRITAKPFKGCFSQTIFD